MVDRLDGMRGGRLLPVQKHDGMEERAEMKSGTRDHICALLLEALLLLDEEGEIVAGIHVNQALEALG